MHWFKKSNILYVCLETGQELSLRSHFKGPYIHLTNAEVLKQFDKDTPNNEVYEYFNNLVLKLDVVDDQVRGVH